MENTNDVQNTGVPNEVKKWNWGAFAFNAWWGIGNKTYLPLLCLIPVFNIIWIFVCGAKGNKWAWEKGDYKDVETFLLVQKTWNKAGFVSFIVGVVFVIVYFIFVASFLGSFFAKANLM